MHFNLNKDSLWLTYPLKTTSFKELSTKIPSTHRLAKCKIFAEDDSDYRLFFNFFEVNTPFFKGNRLEIVTIANNLENNQPSFIILDCFTNVMTWDPIEGIQNSNCKIKRKNTNSIYNVLVTKNSKDKNQNKKQSKANESKAKESKAKESNAKESKAKDQSNLDDDKIFHLKSLKSKIKKSVLPEFSIEPNYLCYFKNYHKGYKLTFNKNEIDKKVCLLKDVKLYHNIYNEYIKDLEHAFIYPQKMNFKVMLE